MYEKFLKYQGPQSLGFIQSYQRKEDLRDLLLKQGTEKVEYHRWGQGIKNREKR